MHSHFLKNVVKMYNYMIDGNELMDYNYAEHKQCCYATGMLMHIIKYLHNVK